MMSSTAVVDPSTTVLCEARNVSQQFSLPNGKSLLVLDNVTLAIQPNEIVALLGPSGCGKSTILRILAGLIRPTQGEVLYHDQPLLGLNPGAAIVFQSFALYPWLIRYAKHPSRARCGECSRIGSERAGREGHSHGRTGRFRGGVSTRTLRRHEAARRHGPGPVGRPGNSVHG